MKAATAAAATTATMAAAASAAASMAAAAAVLFPSHVVKTLHVWCLNKDQKQNVHDLRNQSQPKQIPALDHQGSSIKASASGHTVGVVQETIDARVAEVCPVNLCCVYEKVAKEPPKVTDGCVHGPEGPHIQKKKTKALKKKKHVLFAGSTQKNNPDLTPAMQATFQESRSAR